MLAESVILSIFIALFRGKKLKSLENIYIGKCWLIFLSFGLEFLCGLVVKNNIMPFSSFISKNYMIIHILVYLLLFIFFTFNLNNKGLRLVLIGVMLNFIVIAANNGLMPVDVNMALSKGFNESVNMLASGRIVGHSILVKGETRLSFLADIINIPPPYPFPQTISIGDVFISLGIFLFVQFNVKKIPSTVES